MSSIPHQILDIFLKSSVPFAVIYSCNYYHSFNPSNVDKYIGFGCQYIAC